MYMAYVYTAHMAYVANTGQERVCACRRVCVCLCVCVREGYTNPSNGFPFRASSDFWISPSPPFSEYSSDLSRAISSVIILSWLLVCASVCMCVCV